MHGLGGQQDGEVDHKLPFRAGGAQIEFAAAGDHVVKNGIERKLVLARPPRDQLPDLGAVPPDEDRRRLRPPMPWIGGEETGKVAVVRLRRLEGVERLLLLIMFAKRLAELIQRIGTLARRDRRPLPCDLAHQLVDIFKLLQRRPTGIPGPPVRPRPQPYRKGFGEILVRMALRVPATKMLDITPAGRIGPVIERVVFRRRDEQLLPTPAAMQLVGMLHGMARLMTENGHALGPGAALDLEHHFLLEFHQAGMGEIEGNRNAGHICRAKPFARYPCVWPQPDAPRLQLFIQSAEAILEPGAFDRNPQTIEALLEQLLIRQVFPSIFPTWHRHPEVTENGAWMVS